MASQTLRNKRADAEREDPTVEEHLKILRKDFPDYDRWTIDDFQRFEPRDIRIIRAALFHEKSSVDPYVPQSFKATYGEYANAVFVQSLFREANRRGLDNITATGLLRGAYNQVANIPAGRLSDFDVELPVDTKLLNGQKIRATTTEVLSYSMARDFERGNSSITIPKEVAEAIVQANPTLLDGRLANVGLEFKVGDEAACDSGYFARLGVASNIDSSKVSYDPKNFNFDEFDSFIQDIYNPQKPDKKVNEAWQACWILADMDVQTGDAIARESKPPKTPDLSYANKAANTR